ncbi:uncharacterized protein [Montipora capricornis]|uniref:uncharacterized protein n=1 Tax=Montipora foliosa TaxID=591990 RepID=UPI0035F1CB8A
MRKWALNSEELTEMIKRAEESLSWEPELSCKATPTLTEPNIEEEDWTVSNSNNNVSEETVVKVMGVQWDRMEDNFEFDLATFSRQALEGTFTKRTLLSSTARFYDPLGLLSPVILLLTCMFQEIYHLKLGWDEALPEGLASRWKELLQDMWEVSSIVAPRCILGDVQVEDVTSIQLHGFADASKSAYGANVYIRLTTSGTSSVCLLASKTRVAPLIASQGSKSSVLAHSDLWWKGAPFLKEGEVQWPNLPDNPIGESTFPLEVTKEWRRKPEISNVMTVFVQCFQNISEVISPERFSSLSKLVRVTALVLKFIQKLKRKIEITDIIMEDQNIASKHWYKDVQAKLEEKEKSSSTWEQLGVFKDADGLLRCKGRIQKSLLPYSTKHPILLSRKQHFTKLVIMQSHENVNHNGIGETLTEIRSQFWIIKGRQAVKDVLSKCVTCKKLQGRAYSSPPTPPPPAFRVSEEMAFSKVDNVKTFRDAKVKKFALDRNIDWKFNVPTASWWGGFFEICVKLVKRCLKKVLGNAKLSYEELESVLIETEGVLNSRPLTYVYDELTETPLSPSHLVIGRRLLDQSPAITVAVNTLLRRERYLDGLLTHFRNRWKKEYLTGIREYQKLKRGEPRRTIQVGDVVHTYADKTPRQQWRMGKVEKLLQGQDNVVRAAEVVTVDNSLRKTRLKRPIQKLYPLEINVCDEHVTNARTGQFESGMNIQIVRDEDIPTVITAP